MVGRGKDSVEKIKYLFNGGENAVRIHLKKNKNSRCFHICYKNGGQRWIRTTVPSREQIYSLSPLATRPSTHMKLSKFALDEI